MQREDAKLGTNAEVRALAADFTTVYDLNGRTMIPGIVETHSHIYGAALSYLNRFGIKYPPNEVIITPQAADNLEPKAVSAIVALLEDKEVYIQMNAVEALGVMGRKETIPKLTPFLKDKHPALRVKAAKALAKLGAVDRAEAISLLLDDPAQKVRAASIEALGRLGYSEAEIRIAKLLEDPDYFVRQAAGFWLCHLGSDKGVENLLSGSHYWLFLNALRRPDEWKRLCAKRIPGVYYGTIEGAWAHLAREGGLKFDRGRLHTGGQIIRLDEGTILERLVQLFGWSNEHLILDSNGMRLLSDEEATRFWESWWAEEQKKQPKK